MSKVLVSVDDYSKIREFLFFLIGREYSGVSNSCLLQKAKEVGGGAEALAHLIIAIGRTAKDRVYGDISLAAACCPECKPGDINEVEGINYNLDVLRKFAYDFAQVIMGHLAQSLETQDVMWATRSKSIPLVRIALNKGFDVNAISTSGMTALHIAAAWNLLDIARLLLDKGADINVSDSRGFTPISYARHFFNDEMAKLIEEYVKIR